MIRLVKLATQDDLCAGCASEGSIVKQELGISSQAFTCIL